MSAGEPREVKKARNEVRQKEQGAWDKAEAAGRQARQTEAAQGQKEGLRDRDSSRSRQGQRA